MAQTKRSGSEDLARKASEIRADLRGQDPETKAARCGANYDAGPHGHGRLRMCFWGREITITWHELVVRDGQSGEELPVHTQALILYYVSTCDGTLPLGEWVSFRELSDGAFYQAAFQSYTGAPLVKAFGNDVTGFSRAAEALGGRRGHIGSAGFSVRVFPLVSVMLVYWQGEDEIAPSAQVLFDGAVSHHLPTYACAILGGTLARRLIKAKAAR